MLFVKTLKEKDIETIDKVELLVSYLDLSNEEFNKSIVMFANDILNDIDLAKTLALDYFEHGYIEIGGFSLGMFVYDDYRFFDYLEEEFYYKLKK